MDEHMPPQIPSSSSDDERDDAWQDIGSHKPLTPEEKQILAAQGVGSERLVQREKSHQDDIRRGIGTSEPPLNDDARVNARQQYLEISRARLEVRRQQAMQITDESERLHELARIRAEDEKLNK